MNSTAIASATGTGTGRRQFGESGAHRSLVKRHADGMGDLIGRSAVMRDLFRLIDRVGPTDATVLIVGESGCGKELVAQLIHAASTRATGPFLAINCGAIPDNLIEAELFGHEKGSFTGAVQGHAGVFERAGGGTLFLDEVTEMPIGMQTRLLRALESRRFRRVGGSRELDADIRVIAATNRDPMDAVRNGDLREDLLYRLAVFPIDVPPLRNRQDDVLLLADRFLAQLNQATGSRKRLSANSMATLSRHSWPGNVRELRNAIERAFILSDDCLELAPMLPQVTEAAVVVPPAATVAGDDLFIRVGSRIADVERALIEATLRSFSGNKRRTAEVLGCSLKTLYNKLNAYSRATDLV